MLLRVDSLDPSLSTEVVSISTTTEGGEQWIFNLKDPFPFAHTHGSGPNGQGSIIMTGWFDSLDIEQTIELEDKVGPVLTEMWLDPWDKTRSYFRVSEPLASLNQENWIFDKRLGAPEWTPQTDSLLFNESTGIYTLRVKNEPRNLILGNDSARLVSSTIEGIVDRNGNRPHLSNPYVVVRGTRGSANSLVTAFVNPLLQSDVNAPTLPPQSADSTGDFHVLILNPLTRQFEEPSGETVDQHFAKSMLTLRVDAALPQLYGTDSSGNALQGMMVNGVLAWSTDIQVRGYFYDLLGQFITSKMAHITIDNVHQINENGSISLALVWVSDPLIGLVSRSGRAVGTGVILATVQADITSTSLFDLPVYESDGSKSTKSIDKGKVIHNKKKSVTKIGYYRQ